MTPSLKKKKKKNPSLKTNKNPSTVNPRDLALPQLHFLFCSVLFGTASTWRSRASLILQMGKLRPRQRKGLTESPPADESMAQPGWSWGEGGPQQLLVLGRKGQGLSPQRG